jgi:transposase
MGHARKKYTQQYKDEAVQLVINSGRPMAEIARDLGINEGTLGSWVTRAKQAGKVTEKQLTVDERARLKVAIQLGSGVRCGRAGLPADVGCLTAGAWWRGGGGGPLRCYGGVVAGGSQGPSVNSQVSASRASMPHLAVVDR